jgi:hypothetical protein
VLPSAIAPNVIGPAGRYVRARTPGSTRVALAFAEAGAQWSPVVEADYFASVSGLVASGAGWSVVDPLSTKTFQHLGLINRPFEPAIYYEISAFCVRDREPSILA